MLYYIYMRSKADVSQFDLLHGTENKNQKITKKKTKNKKTVP